MFAIRDDKNTRVIHISKGFEMVRSGYRVCLHDLPSYTFLVASSSIDDAQRIAFRFAQSEGRAKSNAATIQRF